MKKVAGLTLLILSAVYADITEVQSLYERGDYAGAVTAARKDTADYGKVQLHLLWAKSAMALGRVDEAVAAYERVLMLDPGQHEARLRLAKLYAETGRMMLVKQLAEKTDEYTPTEKEKAAIAVLFKENGSMKTFARLGAGYDSNINVSPGDINLLPGSEEIGSGFVRFQAGLEHTRTLEKSRNLYIRGSAGVSLQYNEEKTYNLYSGLVSAGIGYRKDRYDFYFPVCYSRMYYLRNDFLGSVSAEPRLSYLLDTELVGIANVKYIRRDFVQATDKGLADTAFGGGAGLFWLPSGHKFFIKVNYHNHRAGSMDPLPYVSKQVSELYAGVSYRIDSLYSLIGRYGYRYTVYDDTLPESTQRRRDHYHDMTAGIQGSFFEGFKGSCQYEYIVNDTNYGPARYRKHVMYCGLDFRY